MVKTIFFASSLYSNIILDSLLKIKDFDTVAVVTKPDKPAGRSQAITANPVSNFAKKHHLNLIQPTDFDNNFISSYQKLKPDLALSVAYGPPFFNQNMIDIPKYKIINIHPSPLPKYRGATPGPWQIINREISSAITFFQIDPLPDHGPIISQIPFKINSTWTSHDFYQNAFSLASQHLEKILKSYIQNPTSLQSQDHSQKSYYPKFTKKEALIDWSWPIAKIEAFIRATNPWPIAWTYVLNQTGQKLTLKIFSAGIKNNQLEPNQVQIEGKKLTTWDQIQNHYQIIL